DHDTAPGAVFSTGIHLVTYKPIASDRLRNSLRAVQPDGRRPPHEFDRVELRVPAVLHMSDQNVPASILDISAGGVALSTKHAIPKALVEKTTRNISRGAGRGRVFYCLTGPRQAPGVLPPRRKSKAAAER